jgi:hypothetical protein
VRDRVPSESERIAGLGPREIAGRILSGRQRSARLVGRTFLLLALVLAGWIVALAVSLPSQGVIAHQDVVWVGFDIGLLFGLVATAWAALRRSRTLPVVSAATATLLLTDAWFDVVGSGTRAQAGEALAMALLVELPLSALCWWIALHSQTLAEQRVAWLVFGRFVPSATVPSAGTDEPC